MTIKWVKLIEVTTEITKSMQIRTILHYSIEVMNALVTRRFQHKALSFCGTFNLKKNLKCNVVETNVHKGALVISVCSKQLWVTNELERWRECNPQRGPTLQTGSRRTTCKTQNHSSVEWISCHLHIKTQYDVPVEYDKHHWAIWSDEGRVF